MTKAIAGWLGRPLSEPAWFFTKSCTLLLASGTILWVALAADYPAVHDAMHNFRHALAVVPCH